MVVTARVGKRPAAEVAHRMTDELNPTPTTGAKIFGVCSVKELSAATATRRIEPIDQPTKTFRDRPLQQKFHSRSN
jgi:hypothetical protein